MHFTTKLALGFLALASGTLACPGYSGDIDEVEGAAPLDKRYFLHRDFALSSKGYARWPKAEVFFCFDSSVSQSDQQYLTTALPDIFNSKWKANSPSIAHLTIQAGGDLCNNPSSTRNILTVSTNSEKNVATGADGHTLTLDLAFMRSKSYAYDIEVAIAHELGHVYGLEHEHQRKDFWDVDHRGSLANGQQTTTFYCENLSDYDAMVKQLGKNKVDTQLCRDITQANSYGFSAGQWLPIQQLDSKPQSDFTSTEIDYSSLMMYPGQAGGRSSRVPGRGRKIVMSNPNDPDTALNKGNEPTRASGQDIAGLAAMYPCEGSSSRMFIRRQDSGEPVCGVTPSPTALPSITSSIALSSLPGWNTTISEIGAAGTGTGLVGTGTGLPGTGVPTTMSTVTAS